MKKEVGRLEYDRFVVPYRIYGEGSKTIACLSGAKQTMSAWKSFISYFQSDYRVLVFDMPGQGRAEIISGSARVSWDEQLEIMHALFDATGFLEDEERLVFGGSWGSVLAAGYAVRHPDVLHKMVLASFGTKPNVVLKSVIGEVRDMILAGRAQEIAPMMLERFGQFVPDTLKRQILLQFSNMSDEQYQSFYEHSVFVLEMGDLNKYVDLSAIKAETLVIMGQFDSIMDVFDTRKSANEIPNAQYQLVKGVGHFLHWEREEILARYEAFFNQRVGQSGADNIRQA